MHNSTFKAKRKHLASHHQINAPLDVVFPLLCPVREFDWIAHWQCDMLYSDSGMNEAGCVFTTETGETGGRDVWVVSQYVTNQKIQFVRVNQIRSIIYDVILSEQASHTRVDWCQQLTALNEAGNIFIESVELRDFDSQISRLGILLNHYIATGTAWQGV